MPHYIEVRIENGRNHEELTPEEMEGLANTIKDYLQEVNDVTGLSDSDKVGRNVSILNTKTYEGVPDEEIA